MKKSREELIEVYRDTERSFDEFPDLSDKYELLKLADPIPVPESRKINNTVVEVINEDCVEVARHLSTQGNTCMLNMASRKRPGGGVNSGAMAQEEELARRSNLMKGLPSSAYPLKDEDFIYTFDVWFFKDRNYNRIKPFRCDILTMAAVNLNSERLSPRDYLKLMKRKIENIVYWPHEMGTCNNLVLSAFGCGVFKNDPSLVSSLFADVISKGTPYDKIVFAILNDNNSVGNNFQIFSKILSEARFKA